MIFFGAKNNEDYPKNKLVYYDCDKKVEIFSAKFEEDILGIKILGNFVFVCFKNELRTLYNEDSKLVEKCRDKLDENYPNIFEVWSELDEDEDISKIYISYPSGNKVIINYRDVSNWESPTTIEFDFKKKIQNIFYIQKLNYLYVVDENGSNIYEYDVKNPIAKFCYQRGYSQPSKISSITLIHGKYLAVNSSNRNIHIFNTVKSEKSYFSFQYFFDLLGNFETIQRCMKISYNELDSSKEGAYFSSCFSEKGAILVGDEEKDELNVIAYNGFFYCLELDFQKYTYKILKKKKYGERHNDKKISLLEPDDVNEIPTNKK